MDSEPRADGALEALKKCPHLHLEERHYYTGAENFQMASAWWCHDCNRFVDRPARKERP